MEIVMNRSFATLVAALVVSAATLIAASPVSASPAPNNYGSTVTCRYRVTEEGTNGWTEALLRKLVVTPPTIYAKNGPQLVGWRFIVKRSLDRWNTPWVVTYRSPIQKRQATTSTPADFARMRIGVTVPTNVEDQQHVWYRLTLKIFRYAADGSVASNASSRFTDYTVHVAGEAGASDLYCEGLARQYFD
jgi:hypothetical protein